MKHVTDVGRYVPLKSYWIGDCCVYVYSRHGLAALRDVLTALTHAEGQG